MTQEPAELVFRIDPAAESDWPFITEGQEEIAWIALGEERRAEMGRPLVAESVREQVETMRQDEGFPDQAFVARAPDGRRAGYIWVAKTHNDFTGELEASLLSQYVADPYRGQGLGRRLMETAETWARAQGLPRLALSVGVDSTIAQGLYKSLGYQVESLRMSKPLDDD